MQPLASSRTDRTGELEASPILFLGTGGPAGPDILGHLLEQGASIIVVSPDPPDRNDPGLTWMQQDLRLDPIRVEARTVVCADAGLLPLVRGPLERLRSVRRAVILSSASVHFKQASPDPAERASIRALAEAERRLGEWAERQGVDVTLLRPTMIHGGARDQGVSVIAGMARRHRWLPIAGRGLRQPIHAGDLAALMPTLVPRRGHGFETFDLGGGETLPYPDFLRRIASSVGADPTLVRVPAGVLTLGVKLAHACGRLQSVTPAMVRRQRMDLVVDDTPARETLAWNPRPFRPSFTPD